MSQLSLEQNRIELFPHNQIAYESVISQLVDVGKAAIIHPTGTGKSFITFKLAEEHPLSSICLLAPSEYMYKTQVENLKRTTGGYAPDNITFFTYAKLAIMEENELNQILPDYIVLDEFHRCGATEWGKGVQRLLAQYPNTPVLGLSATSIRYLDNQRDMADELFDGNIASEMSLSEAIVRGILPAPKYVVSLYSCQQELERYERRVRRTKNMASRQAADKYLEALRRAVDKAEGLDVIFQKHLPDHKGKYIIFCANREHLDEITSHITEWFGNIDDSPHVYTVYAEAQDSDQSFTDFKADDSDHLKLLLCIDMLNEGVHVNDISGVILFRPTVSPIIYKQQIGRALAANSRKTPLIFDVVNNHQNLYSIGSIQAEMREIVTFYRNMSSGDEVVRENFEIIDEVRECRELFSQLEMTLSASWELMFAAAKQYYERRGDLDVPAKYKTETGLTLGAWITTQRKVRKGKCAGTLTEDRITKLDSIGMIWENIYELHWEKCFEQAKQYFEERGNLDVSPTYETSDGFMLGQWIVRMRQAKVNGLASQMTPEREVRLNELAMIWDKVSYQWEKHYLAATEYYLKHGDLDVPTNYFTEDGFNLGAWIARQRLAKEGQGKNAQLTKEQIARLDAIGMIWLPRFDAQWEKSFLEAEKYHQVHSDLLVPIAYKSNDIFLGKWIANQRNLKRKGKLSEECFLRLDALGMTWEKPDGWEQKYEIAVAYFEENGDLEIDPLYKAEDGTWLGKWIQLQRKSYADGKLGDERYRRLSLIGMRWESLFDINWKKYYGEVKAFYLEHGHVKIPENHQSESGMNLQAWLRIQCKSLSEGKLHSEQINRLNELGISAREVTTPDDLWEERYREAKLFFEKHGHLRVPYTAPLRQWLDKQKRIYHGREKNNRLTEERIERLEAIGMNWVSEKDRAWEAGYESAKQYRERYGLLNPPMKYVDDNGRSLWEWLNSQKKRYRQGKLPDEKVMRLNALDAHWIDKTRSASIERANAGVGREIHTV